jgi:hypothetical protein
MSGCCAMGQVRVPNCDSCRKAARRQKRNGSLGQSGHEPVFTDHDVLAESGKCLHNVAYALRLEEHLSVLTVERLLFVRRQGMAGENEHRNGLRAFVRLVSEPVEETEAGEIRHPQIENDSIDLMVEKGTACLHGPRRFVDVVPRFDQRATEDIPNTRLVVNDEHASRV